jgi:hypothetical protein
MFVLAKGSLRFQAWRPYDYTDRFNWICARFLQSIEHVADRDSVILCELERINALMVTRSPALTSNELLLHVALENWTSERMASDARIAHVRRCCRIRDNAPLFDADEDILIAAGVAWRNHVTPHGQDAYEAANRLLARDPMNPRLWDFIESTALPTLLNTRGAVMGWSMVG